MKKKSILLAILLSICLFSTLTFFLVLNQKTTWEKQYDVVYMNSGSMEPALQRGDLLVIDRNINAAELNAALYPEGDIIVFHKPGLENELIVHRAVSKVENDDTCYFETKGDANSIADKWSGPETWDNKISERLLVGKVVDVNPPLTIPLWKFDSVLTVTHWNFWLLLTATVALGSGVSSLLIFLLAPSQKKKAIPPPPLSSVEKKQIKPTTPQTESIHCIYCGGKLPLEAVYCRKCGKKVE